MQIVTKAAVASLIAVGAAVASLPRPAGADACQAVVSGLGTGRGILGKGTERARAAAVVDWEGKVRARHGLQFASFKGSANPAFDCRSGLLGVTCVAVAAPCRVPGGPPRARTAGIFG
jgi:hypothetical protein